MSRVSLYFGKRDRDIKEALNLDQLDKGDINYEVKELMRDGIKYRNANSNTPTVHVTPVPVNHTPSNDMLFDDVEVKKKELDEMEIKNKLANF